MFLFSQLCSCLDDFYADYLFIVLLKHYSHCFLSFLVFCQLYYKNILVNIVRLQRVTFLFSNVFCDCLVSIIRLMPFLFRFGWFCILERGNLFNFFFSISQTKIVFSGQISASGLRSAHTMALAPSHFCHKIQSRGLKFGPCEQSHEFKLL